MFCHLCCCCFSVVVITIVVNVVVVVSSVFLLAYAKEKQNKKLARTKNAKIGRSFICSDSYVAHFPYSSSNKKVFFFWPECAQIEKFSPNPNPKCAFSECVFCASA